MGWTTRRGFLKAGAALGAAALAGVSGRDVLAAEGADIQFGLVTYQWGRDWDIPTLIKNCTTAGLLGVELRSTHKHGVEPSLSAEQREIVKKQFADSPVKLISLGSAEDFHSPDPEKLKKSIENTKAFIKLAKDVGASGVKVRPNDLPKNVPVEKTIEQIGKSLNIVGAYAADFGQQIRLEVHGGGTSKLPVIKQIMDIATQPNVAVCWNSNNTDLEAPGLEQNFKSVRDRMGYTTHVRQLDTPGYPWAELIKLFVTTGYKGWLLLEAGGKDPADRVAAMVQQKKLFDDYMAKAKG